MKSTNWLLMMTNVSFIAQRYICNDCNDSFGLAGDKKRGRSRQHITGVSFGARGDKVVASYHGDHAYSFDITRSSQDAAESALAYAAPSAEPHPSKSVAANGLQEVWSTSGRGNSANYTRCTLGTE